MTSAERAILGMFRQYDVGPNQMLCFNSKLGDKYQKAMRVLLDKGLVVKDRPKHAYSLTLAGYEASREI